MIPLDPPAVAPVAAAVVGKELVMLKDMVHPLLEPPNAQLAGTPAKSQSVPELKISVRGEHSPAVVFVVRFNNEASVVPSLPALSKPMRYRTGLSVAEALPQTYRYPVWTGPQK